LPLTKTKNRLILAFLHLRATAAKAPAVDSPFEQSLVSEQSGLVELVMTAPSVVPWPSGPLQNRSGALDDGLISLCDHVEALASGSIAGLTICNSSRTHIERAIFPRLTQFAAAIRAIPLSPSDFGSCVQAIAHGETITCPDIADEKRFDPQWRRLCLDHGIRALQSRPIYLRERPFATFVLAYRRSREVTDWNVALMKFAADAAGLIIQSDLERANIAAE
jgi:GAF domain-containing protein